MATEISVLFQNDAIVVVNKPLGVSVHNQEASSDLLERLGRQLQRDRLLPIHRLDKETSGVQILAFDPDSARIWAEQFQSRACTKIYRGILRGALESPTGSWTAPLTDKAEGRKNPAGLGKDRIPCETKYRVVNQSRYFSECEFELITGRQHQIRKHAALAHHHLVGDPRYGDPKYNAKISSLYGIDRLFLHCASLAVLGHTFQAEVPPEFARLFESA